MRRLRLVKTCGACPEQYDVYDDDRAVGYLRLRHGYFRAEFLPTDEVVYTAEVNGDGCFEDDERVRHLNAACRAIAAKLEEVAESNEEEPEYDLADEYEE